MKSDAMMKGCRHIRKKDINFKRYSLVYTKYSIYIRYTGKKCDPAEMRPDLISVQLEQKKCKYELCFFLTYFTTRFYCILPYWLKDLYYIYFKIIVSVSSPLRPYYCVVWYCDHVSYIFELEIKVFGERKAFKYRGEHKGMA